MQLGPGTASLACARLIVPFAPFSVRFYVDREEVDPELLFEVPPGLGGEDTGVHFLMEHVLGPLGGVTTFEKHEGPEDFLLFIVELLQG